MQSTYLKESLAKLATLKARSEQIQSAENRATIKDRIAGSMSDSVYPTMCGELSGVIMLADWDVKLAQAAAERLEVIEREHERFVSIFEALDIELDESTMATLELIGKRTWSEGSRHETSPYKDERRAIANAVSKAVADVQESEREFEHEQAIDAITAAGFVRHETDDFDGWVRRDLWTDTSTRLPDYSITIDMQYKNHITTYSWDLSGIEGDSPADGPVIASGKSGEFHRLLGLVALASKEVTQ